MKKIILGALAFTAASVAVAVVAPRITNAADHLDGPRASADPAADITDVYAFMSPDPATSTHLVLVMDVFPKASATSAFSDKVTYSFRVNQVQSAQLALGPALDVTCSLASATTMKCDAPGGLTKTVTIGAVGTCAAADNICVYAGLRSDPFFFDLKGFNDTVVSSPQGLKFTGTNFFAGFNVLTIVVEFSPTAAAFPKAPTPYYTVAAETNRKP